MSENDQRFEQLRAELRRNLASNTQRLRRLKGERENRKISQEKAALESKIDRTMISKIERARTNLTLDTLIRLADYLEVSVADLLQEATN
jgi:transcriptional regulator with XRE-family HTH domain